MNGLPLLRMYSVLDQSNLILMGPYVYCAFSTNYYYHYYYYC